MTKTYCNTCSAVIEGAQSACPNDNCPAKTSFLSNRIKSVKCKTCQIQVPFNSFAMDTAVVTCKKDRDPGRNGCGLKQMRDFFDRMEEKKKGLPKKLPIPALLKEKPCSEQECSDRREGGVPCGNCSTQGILQNLEKVLEQSKPVLEVQKDGEGTFGFEVEDPIQYFIAKNGRIEQR